MSSTKRRKTGSVLPEETNNSKKVLSPAQSSSSAEPESPVAAVDDGSIEEGETAKTFKDLVSIFCYYVNLVLY